VSADLLGWVVPLRHAHVALVVTCGSLFLARGIGVLLAAHWPMHPAAARVSVAIDSALLAAGVSLWSILQLHPLRDAWLGAKLVLLVAYIVLGSFALKRARRTAGRAAFLLAALLVFATMVSVALTRDPLGFWRVN
jgi:uncharacterized membrane protein SirB2